MAGALEGVRVIDLTTMISGPMATMILGDQGADVVKVEPPGVGDMVRHMGTRRAGFSAFFAGANRNKRSIALDLKDPRGVDLLRQLVRGADVFVQNFRPGAIERMGLGEAALREIQPDLVYVSISGFGETGPYAHHRVYDNVIQALSGLCAVQADPGTSRPASVRTLVPDKIAALTAAQAISTALFARERTGKGQHVRLAMLDALIAWLWPDAMMNHTFLGEGVTTTPSISTVTDVFATADGFITAIPVADAEWQGLCRAIDRADLATDPRFATLEDRMNDLPEYLRVIEEALERAKTAELIARLDAEDVPAAPILTLDEVIADRQVVENELVVESTHPVAGRMREPRPAPRFEATPAGIRRPAPGLGEHSDEVLREAGITEIASLRAAGVVH
jgi:crotonobetainyl-CoA:carnitine CoA-transferase CaiB-like acyl-CoA transferase